VLSPKDWLLKNTPKHYLVGVFFYFVTTLFTYSL
jgi:hypothetical protein